MIEILAAYYFVKAAMPFIIAGLILLIGTAIVERRMISIEEEEA